MLKPKTIKQDLSIAEMKKRSETDPRNQRYNKYKKDPTSSVPQIGDKKINFNTVNGGKTYTKTIIKDVSSKKAQRVQKRSPEKRWGDDALKITKTISGNAATRQATRLGKRIENQPETYQKKGGVVKTKKK
jgi:hypothetical protein